MTAPQSLSQPASQASGSTVVTRFAPSPTGYLHIGGARTALFNYLFARKAGGRFLLRIEDTDRARSTPQATQAILDGLAWLGLDYDGEPMMQFARAYIHKQAALDLVERGGAYRCYLTAGQESELKDQARAAGRAFRSPWRNPNHGFPEPAADAPFVVRLRAPSENSQIIVQDQVMGDVITGGREIDDFILLRSDATPTYMLAVVVDDHDMGVSHVIRGDDHLTNAARQTALINAFGWRVPVYAHVPLIHGDDGKKLSKRHGALGVEEYRDMGYLPEALRAYLLRLGWSKGDVDIVSSEEALELFDVEGIGKSPSRLDFAKMGSVNAHFIKLADNVRLCALVHHILVSRGEDIDAAMANKLTLAMPYLKERAKTLLELADQCAFILLRGPLELGEKSLTLLTPEARERVGRASDALGKLEIWSHDAIKDAIGAFAVQEGVGFGKVGPMLRAALTDNKTSLDLGMVMEILGRDESLARLCDVA